MMVSIKMCTFVAEQQKYELQNIIAYEIKRRNERLYREVYGTSVL